MALVTGGSSGIGASTVSAFAREGTKSAPSLKVALTCSSSFSRQALERGYGVPIKPGRYWYDSVSGVWGLEGGPAEGQIHPGLRLGGALKRDASKGRTGVIVNGRELHALDVAALRRCVTVIPGSYWVLANGIGGKEGGPAQLNLAVLCENQASGSGSSTR